MQKTYSENELPELSEEKCSVIYALEIIGGKWKLPVIWKLSKQKSIRYNALKRSLNGITNIMLTRALQDLEKNGLVQRIAYNMYPPHVEYSLTEDAKKLIPALKIIGSWGREKMMREGHL